MAPGTLASALVAARAISVHPAPERQPPSCWVPWNALALVPPLSRTHPLHPIPCAGPFPGAGHRDPVHPGSGSLFDHPCLSSDPTAVPGKPLPGYCRCIVRVFTLAPLTENRSGGNPWRLPRYRPGSFSRGHAAPTDQEPSIGAGFQAHRLCIGCAVTPGFPYTLGSPRRGGRIFPRYAKKPRIVEIQGFVQTSDW